MYAQGEASSSDEETSSDTDVQKYLMAWRYEKREGLYYNVLREIFFDPETGLCYDSDDMPIDMPIYFDPSRKSFFDPNTADVYTPATGLLTHNPFYKGRGPLNIDDPLTSSDESPTADPRKKMTFETRMNEAIQTIRDAEMERVSQKTDPKKKRRQGFFQRLKKSLGM